MRYTTTTRYNTIYRATCSIWVTVVRLYITLLQLYNRVRNEVTTKPVFTGGYCSLCLYLCGCETSRQTSVSRLDRISVMHDITLINKCMIGFKLSFFLCSHILFSPESYHVGTTETFTFTSYSPENLTIRAVVSYKVCECARLSRSYTYRTCRNSASLVFKEEQGTAVRGE